MQNKIDMFEDFKTGIPPGVEFMYRYQATMLIQSIGL